METHLFPAGKVVERPWYAWLALIAALFTGISAIPVGIMFLLDPSGSSVGLTSGWIEATVFRSYVIPGLYLLIVNGLGMLILAALIIRRHWTAPWLSGILGAGLICWIVVQLALLPETMFLQVVFLATGLLLGFVALLWLRRTRQLRLW